MTGVSDGQAALERGRPLMLVSPPAVEHAGAVWKLLAEPPGQGAENPGRRPGVLVVCSDSAAAEAWADAAPEGLRLHPVTGLGRTTRLLAAGAVDVLAATPEDLQALAATSALKLDQVTTVVLAWPEWLLATDRLPVLEQLLGETREARRIVLAWNPQALEDLLERYARRPHVLGDLPLGDDARPLPPVGAARYAIVPASRRASVRRELLDAIDRPRVAEWRRSAAPLVAVDVVLCLDLPSRQELAEVAQHGAPVLVLAPEQLPYARSIAAPLTALPLTASRAKGRSDADELRARVAARLDQGGLEPELGLLEPLLERFDAAEVAAALLAMRQESSSVIGQRFTEDRQPTTTPGESGVKVFINVGKKDRASAKDLVGALTREVGIAREDIGRIEVRDTFCLVHMAPHAADAAIRGLSRVAIRGRRVSARRDRES